MRQDAVTGQTTFHIGEVQVNFYVREPSPDRWNAIGVVTLGDETLPDPAESTCRMIVGTGSTRDEAVGDLITRVLSGSHPALRQQVAQLSSSSRSVQAPAHH